MTVRDLLKWASRLHHTSSLPDLALEGFLVLGERARIPGDKDFIKRTIEQVCGLKTPLNMDKFYREYFQKELARDFEGSHLVISGMLRRVAVLVDKCLREREPVLMVGETGCGKTSLCEVFARIRNQQLYSINCH